MEEMEERCSEFQSKIEEDGLGQRTERHPVRKVKRSSKKEGTEININR